MSNKNPAKVIRRSVALSGTLLHEALRVAAPELKNNVNRLVTTALKEFVEKRRRREFETAMEKMSRDPAIRRECRSISDGFLHAEKDGISDD